MNGGARWGVEELLAVTTWPTDGAVQCDQAVFTSIRSATAEGYRIVGSSLGVRQEEKLDLTRRSPSHGGMCADHDTALGLIAYPAASGRYCVCCCRLAGAEHTARGGQRVHTHAVLLSDEQFKRFEYNAVRVLSSLIRATRDLVLTEQPVMEQLSLQVPTAEHVCATPPSSLSAELVRHVVICLLDTKQRICAHGSRPLAAVELALSALPTGLRAGASLSVGIAYSPSRRVHLAMIDGDVTETKRIIRGQPIECLDAEQLPGLDLPEYDLWLAFVDEALAAHHPTPSDGSIRLWRSASIRQVANRLPYDSGASELNRIARMRRDLDQARRGDASQPNWSAQRAALFATYCTFQSQNELERELADQIRQYTQPPPEPR